MARKRKKTRRSNNPHGRPSSGLTKRVLLAVSPWMAKSMAAAAARMGISTSEVWRLAARNALGWPSNTGGGVTAYANPERDRRECACVSDDAARCLEQRERGYVLTEDDEEYTYDRDECGCFCHCVNDDDNEDAP